MKHLEGCHQLLLVKICICALAKLYAISKDSWMYLDPLHDTSSAVQQADLFDCNWISCPMFKVECLVLH